MVDGAPGRSGTGVGRASGAGGRRGCAARERQAVVLGDGGGVVGELRVAGDRDDVDGAAVGVHVAPAGPGFALRAGADAEQGRDGERLPVGAQGERVRVPAGRDHPADLPGGGVQHEDGVDAAAGDVEGRLVGRQEERRRGDAGDGAVERLQRPGRDRLVGAGVEGQDGVVVGVGHEEPVGRRGRGERGRVQAGLDDLLHPHRLEVDLRDGAAREHAARVDDDAVGRGGEAGRGRQVARRRGAPAPVRDVGVRAAARQRGGEGRDRHRDAAGRGVRVQVEQRQPVGVDQGDGEEAAPAAVVLARDGGRAGVLAAEVPGKRGDAAAGDLHQGRPAQEGAAGDGVAQEALQPRLRPERERLAHRVALPVEPVQPAALPVIGDDEDLVGAGEGQPPHLARKDRLHPRGRGRLPRGHHPRIRHLEKGQHQRR